MKIQIGNVFQDWYVTCSAIAKLLSWAENLNKLFTDLGGKFKFSAQDSDLEYLFRRSKNSPVSSDLSKGFSAEQA